MDLEQIKELWKNPKNKSAISKAGRDNDRQLFHAQLCFELEDSTPYLNLFLRKVERMLNNTEKFEKFKSLLTFPLPSNHLISKATDEWNKVFKAQDRAEEYKFTDESLNSDFQAFLEKIDFNSVIEQNLFTKVKQAANTIAVVDVENAPTEGAYTEPYIYFIETGRCKDVEVDYSGKIKHLLFERGTFAKEDRQLVVIDTEYYRVYDISNTNDQLYLVSESAHYLGFCPATFAWLDIIDPDLPIRRYNSVSEIVDDFDKYVIGDVFCQHIDLYASFPILWKYGNDCDLEENEEGNPAVKPESPYLGPGLQVDLILPEGDNFSMTPPVGFVEPKTALLEYNRKKLKELEVSIFKHLTGFENEVQDEKAFNESQIKARNETRHASLRYWAENMQATHKFLIYTIAKLRYREKFVSVSIDYGNDYLLYDAITAAKEYEDAKRSGLPMYVIASKRSVVTQIETRNSPNRKARFEVLEQLEPYLDVPLSNLDPTTPDYELKANFASYIDKFERINGDIVTFGTVNVSFEDKIDLIKSNLYEYVKQTRKFQQENSIERKDFRQPGQGQELRVSTGVEGQL